jgi:DNA-binding SARP family transcriptional activator
MPTFSIQLFGKFCVRHDQQILEGFEARKVQELFCYLLLHRDHSLSRETLASILWSDTTTAQSKKNLRQAFWQLQSALGAHNEQVNERVLLVEPDWVQLNTEANFWLDVEVFEKTYKFVQKTPGQELDNATAQLLEDTIQLYQGPLLEGWYLDWCLLERERLQSMYLTMLDKLMSFCEMGHDYETGLFYGMRIMCYDRARERTHRRMMRLYYLTGDRAEALRQYERCAVALEEELGISPSKNTIAIYNQIQADQLDEPSPTLVDSDTPHEVPAPPLLEVLGHLAQVQRNLDELQNQVQQSIHLVKMALQNNK